MITSETSHKSSFDFQAMQNCFILDHNTEQEKYSEVYNPKYDFFGQSYSSMYPNLHKYPATMLPQIGLELLKEFKVKKSNLLDPYCGSGSSFVSGLEYGIKEFIGFDLNPLAIMISRAKLEFIDPCALKESMKVLFDKVSIQRHQKQNLDELLANVKILENITNIDFWIEKKVQNDLVYIYKTITLSYFSKNKKEDLALKNLFSLAFSETLREASYTRNNEFKLFRMKDYQNYKPQVLKIFISKVENICQKYLDFYYPKLCSRTFKFSFYNQSFESSLNSIKFDTILTSPPYGDSKTTVAYGQFSTFINEWLGVQDARKLDSKLMGGIKAKYLYQKGLIQKYIMEISEIDKKRALEISSFYFDLEYSIQKLINAVNEKGKVFFVVGNRTVKNIELPTSKFIAEIFSENGFKHLQTIRRKISNKSMPLKNSPTNKIGKLSKTMNEEWIVVCEKK